MCARHSLASFLLVLVTSLGKRLSIVFPSVTCFSYLLEKTVINCFFFGDPSPAPKKQVFDLLFLQLHFQKGDVNVKIVELCNALRAEFINNGYRYGFIVNEKVYMPNMQNGFDEEFYHQAKTVSRVQDPMLTRKEKIGTCIDAVLVMRQILNEHNVSSKIWLLYQKERNKVHTILTFEAEDKIVYLELTPESNKPWYGKEIIYDDEQTFLKKQENNGLEVFDVTDRVIVGERPQFLLEKLK